MTQRSSRDKEINLKRKEERVKETHHHFCISPIRFTSSVFCHLEELWVDSLVGLSKHRDEVAGLPHVVWCEEGIGCACLLATSRSANAVDIVLGVVGVVKVDDKFDVFNICNVAVWHKKRTAHKMCTGATTTTGSKTKEGKLVRS